MSLPRHRWVAPALAGMIGMIMSAERLWADNPPQGFTVRSIIRKGIDDQGRCHGDLAKATGLANATSLAYKVLLLNPDGSESSVDASKTTFRFGQQFRIEIEADSNLYVYVFHEGPDGVRTILLPDTIDKGRIPMVKQGQKKVLPDDGTYFEFVEPAGMEKLLVYASPEPKNDLTPKAAFDGVKDKDKNQKLIEMKSQQDKVIGEATKNQPKEAITTPDIQKVVESNEVLPEFRLRGLRWQPEAENLTEGKTILVGSYDPKVRPDLFLQISLETK
ncbi:DUF4384 domain-containing protein [bacterium]|nr:DUF4384 domain-containing protein [bacterium]